MRTGPAAGFRRVVEIGAIDRDTTRFLVIHPLPFRRFSEFRVDTRALGTSRSKHARCAMVEINLYAQLAIAKRSHHGKDEAGAANPKPHQ